MITLSYKTNNQNVLKLSLLHRWKKSSVSVLWKKFFFFSVRVFFREHSRFTEQQEKGEALSLASLYHFHPLHRHLDISPVIAAEISPLHIANAQNRTGNIWFPSASCWPLRYGLKRDVFKGVHKSFAKFSGNQLCLSLRHRVFP